MNLGRVIGTVVAERKYEGLEGLKLLVVQPVDEQEKDKGTPFVAVDTVRAGPGDVVILVGAREAALALDEAFVPVDAAIVGIVDSVDLDRRRQARAR
ncbi:MAG: EutN/CcmL family microcompartment protein [Deltaproteobacteria bacterium]|nr:EutN/CcmL family microcompartment protein [Deltaproteobacteria bacterium]